MALQSDVAILCDLLDAGPATAAELARRSGLSERGINYAMVRLLSARVVAVVGYTDTPPGAKASHRARIFDVGPRVRSWAVLTIKPTADDDE
jgi:hypothetical protein